MGRNYLLGGGQCARPIAFIQRQSGFKCLCRCAVETIIETNGPRFFVHQHGCTVHIAFNLLVNSGQRLAFGYQIHIGNQHQGHGARGVGLHRGVGLGVEIGQKEVAIGAHHVGFSH